MKKLIPLLLVLFLALPAKATQEYKHFIPLSTNTHMNVGVEEPSWSGGRADLFNPLTYLKINMIPPLIMDGPYDTPDPAMTTRLLDGRTPYMIVIKGWFGSPICKLPPLHQWDDFASVVQWAIDTFEPKLIGLYNEPDVLETTSPINYGCVGDGQLYGHFVRYIYDNTHGAMIAAGEVSTVNSGFVNDMLLALDGHFDVFTLHCYEHYKGYLTKWCDDVYLAGTRLTDKPVMIDETGVIYKYGTNYAGAQVEHYYRMKRLIPTIFFHYGLGPNGWPAEMPVEMCPSTGCREVWDHYMMEGHP